MSNRTKKENKNNIISGVGKAVGSKISKSTRNKAKAKNEVPTGRPVDDRPLDEFTPWKDKEEREQREKMQEEQAVESSAVEVNESAEAESAVEAENISIDEELDSIEVPDFNYKDTDEKVDKEIKAIIGSDVNIDEYASLELEAEEEVEESESAEEAASEDEAESEAVEEAISEEAVQDEVAPEAEEIAEAEVESMDDAEGESEAVEPAEEDTELDAETEESQPEVEDLDESEFETENEAADVERETETEAELEQVEEDEEQSVEESESEDGASVEDEVAEEESVEEALDESVVDVEAAESVEAASDVEIEETTEESEIESEVEESESEDGASVEDEVAEEESVEETLDESVVDIEDAEPAEEAYDAETEESQPEVEDFDESETENEAVDAELETESEAVEKETEESESDEANLVEPEAAPEIVSAEALEAKKKRKKILIWVAGVVCAILVICGIAYAAVSGEDKFVDSVSVNGVDVSKMDAEAATAAFTKNLNEVTTVCDNGEAKVVQTSFKYTNKSGLDRLIKFSHLDIRRHFGDKKVEYKLKYKSAEGIEDTATTLKGVYPPEEGETVTQNAYIDYDTMTIVDAVQGTNIDCTKLAKAIADQRCQEPMNDKFEFSKKDFIDEPKVLKEDLDEEFKFAQKYIANGLDAEDPEGEIIHITPKQLSTVVLYSKKGPKYDRDAAIELARALADEYMSSTLTISTQEGERTLYNYALSGGVDAEQTADSIIEAAKSGGTAKLVEDKSKTSEIGDHVEVSISSQTVYLVEGGRVTMSCPVVTGNFGHETPRGIYRLAYKSSPATLKGKNDDGTDYESPVSYWMPFNGSIGLHDAPWRGSFGGSIYRGNGSHGCVNMPVYAARTVFYSISAGDVVIVY